MNTTTTPNKTSNTIAVIGLGSMGYGMACTLLRTENFTVHGFDVAPSSVERFQSAGGADGELKAIAAELDTVVVVVLNADQTEAVLFGDQGVVPKLKAGAVVIACATVAPEFAAEMAARCATYNVHYLDAPISGGAVKAANGQLSIMASGSAEAFTAARPVLDVMAENVFELGDTAGPGSAMKAVNQLLAGVHIASMAEAMTFGIKQGIEADKIVEVITQSAGNSWMFANRAPHIVEGDYTPHSSVDIWPKDLGIVLDIARSLKFPAPLTATALQQFVAASGSGLGQEDDAAVAKIYARNSGVSLPGED
ncbi:MAG: L-threonate dehydrogenase [Thiolinea sp.]